MVFCISISHADLSLKVIIRQGMGWPTVQGIGLAGVEKFPKSNTLSGRSPFPWEDPDPNYYRLAVFCGNPRTKNQLDPFSR